MNIPELIPWVYEHKDETTTYKNFDYYLGDWLGQNADQFRIQFDYHTAERIEVKSLYRIYQEGAIERYLL